jgi:glycosyl transferase family 25
MKIFVINLESSGTRRALMVSQLERLGLDYEIVPAINGHQLSASELAELADPEVVRAAPEWLSPGAIGAALSHREVCRRIAAQGLPFAIILEDDVTLPDNLPSLLAQLEPLHRPDRLVLLYWSSNNCQPFYRQSAIQLDSATMLARAARPENLLSAVMYAVGREAAAVMVAHNTPVRVTADLWGYYLEKGAYREIHCLLPSPIGLANLPSDITYGQPHLWRRLKRWLEAHVGLVRHLSVRRRARYFSSRNRYEWI